MLATHPAFDLSHFEWQHLSDPSETLYKVDDKVVAQFSIENLIEIFK